MDEGFQSRQIIARVAGAATVWAVSELLDRTKARKALERVDRKVDRLQERATTTARLTAKHAGRNARRNLGYVIVGVAALGIAVALFARATRR